MYKKNAVHLQNQDESKVSYANKITKEMKEIHFVLKGSKAKEKE